MLNQKQLVARKELLDKELKFLNEFYIRQEQGFMPALEKEMELLDQLVRLELAFKTECGYFPSTAGQNYLANLS